MTTEKYLNTISTFQGAGAGAQINLLHARIGVTERVLHTYPNGLRKIGVYLPTGELVNEYTLGTA